MTCYCKTRNISDSFLILSSFPYMRDFLMYLIIHKYFDFLLNVPQRLETGNIRACVCINFFSVITRYMSNT